MLNSGLDIETNQLSDLSTYPADATSTGGLDENQIITYVFKIDEKSSVILDCRWHASLPIQEPDIIEFLVRLSVGLKTSELQELQADYVQHALKVLKLKHQAPIEKLLDILKSGLS